MTAEFLFNHDQDYNPAFGNFASRFSIANAALATRFLSGAKLSLAHLRWDELQAEVPQPFLSMQTSNRRAWIAQKLEVVRNTVKLTSALIFWFFFIKKKERMIIDPKINKSKAL